MTIVNVFNYVQALASRMSPRHRFSTWLVRWFFQSLYMVLRIISSFCIFSPVTASSYSPLVPNLYSIQLASRSENPSSRQFMSSIPAPPDANGNPLIALAVAVIYAILYVLQGVRYGVSLITIGIPR